ncbi:MAG TPA: DNA starvation/stationary phase protection protein Dps [Caulifigura sp.]|nr:DNA starvation/stationary phase protection protein Dps [Caulifigura sp.]
MPTFKTRIDVPSDKRPAIIALLNERLADLINLMLQCKQAHWNVKGPHFIALHELFDEQAELIEEHVDTVAERITALGGTAEGTVAAISTRSTLPKYPLEITAGMQHVDALAIAFANTGSLVRQAIDKADELGDADAADIFTAASRELDKQLWFLEAHLQAKE